MSGGWVSVGFPTWISSRASFLDLGHPRVMICMKFWPSFDFSRKTDFGEIDRVGLGFVLFHFRKRVTGSYFRFFFIWVLTFDV